MSNGVSIPERIVMAAAVAMLVTVPLHGQDAPPQAPRFTISGTSTVRAWSCPAEGRVKVAAGKGRPAPGLPAGVGGVTVTVPVAAIACDTPLMNDHLRETLNAAAHADIVYELTDYTMTGPDTAHATGTLTVNGVTKPMALDVKLASSPQGVRATGETTIDMTQYGVTPPAVFDGMLKVGKDVRVKFDAVLPAR